MKRLFIVWGGLLCVFSLRAQTLSPQVVAASGSSLSSADAQIDCTVGEVVTSSFSGGGNHLTQGFHQTQITFTTVENSETEFTFRVYPNPTSQFVTVESEEPTSMKARVYDSFGRVVAETDLFSNSITMDLQTLASASYIMVITNADGRPLHSYTLIKN